MAEFIFGSKPLVYFRGLARHPQILHMLASIVDLTSLHDWEILHDCVSCLAEFFENVLMLRWPLDKHCEHRAANRGVFTPWARVVVATADMFGY